MRVLVLIPSLLLVVTSCGAAPESEMKGAVHGNEFQQSQPVAKPKAQQRIEIEDWFAERRICATFQDFEIKFAKIKYGKLAKFDDLTSISGQNATFRWNGTNVYILKAYTLTYLDKSLTYSNRSPEYKLAIGIGRSILDSDLRFSQGMIDLGGNPLEIHPMVDEGNPSPGHHSSMKTVAIMASSIAFLDNILSFDPNRNIDQNARKFHESPSSTMLGTRISEILVESNSARWYVPQVVDPNLVKPKISVENLSGLRVGVSGRFLVFWLRRGHNTVVAVLTPEVDSAIYFSC